MTDGMTCLTCITKYITVELCERPTSPDYVKFEGIYFNQLPSGLNCQLTSLPCIHITVNAIIKIIKLVYKHRLGRKIANYDTSLYEHYIEARETLNHE